MYTVNQLNNKQNLSDEDLAKMREIYETISYSFRGPISVNDFQELEMEHYEDPNGSSQFFFLTAENDDIVSVTEIVPRKGIHENSINLLLTMVFTNQNYRKQGLIGRLINWIIKYYETGDIESDSTLKVCDSIRNGTSQVYIDSIIPNEIRISNNIHWSLYSIVGTFYKQFGFNACDEINWFEIDSTKIPKPGNLGKFELDSNTEKLLTLSDLDEYYHSDEFSFDKIPPNKGLQNCSLEESSYPGFVERFSSYVKLHKDTIPNPEIFQTCGFMVKEGASESKTVVFLCPFFFMNRIVVNRVYTSTKTVADFEIHWRRILEFIYSYAENVWNVLPEIPDKEKIIMLADNDFISSNGSIKDKDFENVVTKSNGWSNNGLGTVLPMIRDWKELKSPPSKLAYNGHWSFM